MAYQPYIQKSIEYIEDNLYLPLPVGSVAAYAGFSKYHFLRVFQREVGMTIGEYIRMRRLANAAVMLLETELPVIDIAFHCCFSTPEAFTRAFKKLYAMPPGEYRRTMSILAKQKKGGVCMENRSEIKGWFLSGSHPANYEAGLDETTVHQGKRSAFLRSRTVMEEGEFATLMQQFQAKHYLNKRLKLSAFIKTENVESFCGLWMRVDNSSGDMLQFDNMSNRPISGTQNWNFHSVVLDIPENSALIAFGILLSGKGAVWIDQCNFEEVDEKTPATNLEVLSEVLEEPVNLSFEL